MKNIKYTASKYVRKNNYWHCLGKPALLNRGITVIAITTQLPIVEHCSIGLPSLLRRRAGKYDKVEVDEVIQIGAHHGQVERRGVTVASSVQSLDGGGHCPASGHLIGQSLGSLTVRIGRRLCCWVVQHILAIGLVRSRRLHKRTADIRPGFLLAHSGNG